VTNPGDKKNERVGLLAIARDHDRARVELAFGGVHETRIFLGNKEYVVPEQELLAVAGLGRFDQSWDPARVGKHLFMPEYTLSKVRREKVQGVDVWCFAKVYKHGKDRACFDASQSMLMHEDSGDKGRNEFMDFTVLGQQVYPKRVQIFHEHRSPIEVNSITVASASLKDEVFTIPQGSVELETCDDIKPPQATYTPEPEFSEKARREHKNGRVILEILVTKEGKVSAVQVINPDSYGLGDNASATAKTWRFKPAMCGDRPVNLEMAIEVAFFNP
jgi:TonB family protein